MDPEPAPAALASEAVDLWLTKSDVKLARWCMNAFLAHHENILVPINQRSARSQALVAAGTTFDELTRAHVRAEALDLPDLLDAEGQLKDPDMPLLASNSELLVNTELELRGIPDALVWERGCWYPVETKNHTTMTRTDVFELAFYWRLMAPLQDPAVLQPAAGWLILTDGNGDVGATVSTFIPGHVFRELDGIITDCRDAVRAGRQAGWCDCWLCRDMIPEIRNSAGPWPRST